MTENQVNTLKAIDATLERVIVNDSEALDWVKREIKNLLEDEAKRGDKND